VVAPKFFEPPRLPNPRSARSATHRRIVHKSRARYGGIVRIGLVMGCMLLLLMGYVVLTSNLTGLNYAVAGAQQHREALEEETLRLDDRIAALRSDDRLSAIAARLGMREPQRFAYVQIPAPAIARRPRRLAILSSLAGLFMPAIVRHK
jgi:hypothetical protein